MQGWCVVVVFRSIFFTPSSNPSLRSKCHGASLSKRQWERNKSSPLGPSGALINLAGSILVQGSDHAKRLRIEGT